MRASNYTTPLVRKHAQICVSGSNNTIHEAAASVPLRDKSMKFSVGFIESLQLPEHIKTFYDYKSLVGTYERLWDFTIISICSDIEWFFKDLYESKYPASNNGFGFYQRIKNVIADLETKGMDFSSISSEIDSINKAFQQRHIFIHNMGLVDQKFINNTGSTLSVNDKVIINQDDFQEVFKAYGKLLKFIDDEIKS